MSNLILKIFPWELQEFNLGITVLIIKIKSIDIFL